MIKCVNRNKYTGKYEVIYNWADGLGTVEGTREMKVLGKDAVFDRVGSPYGKCVGEVGADGSCATVDQRSIPYYFEESDITKEPSYHRYVVKEDFTKDNIYKKIEETVDEYYNKNTPYYGDNDGLAYGEIAPMFDGTGGGYQYDMPLNMNQLIAIKMIEEIHNY